MTNENMREIQLCVRICTHIGLDLIPL